MNIVKEKLTTNKDCDSIYTVQIKDFHHKMKNWPPGVRILTKKFRVQGQNLCLWIYPNGLNKGFKDRVSAHLWNLNSKKLPSFKIRIGNQPESKVKSRSISQENYSYATLCNHVKVYPNFKADEELKVVCTIMKVTAEEEIKVKADKKKETKVHADKKKLVVTKQLPNLNCNCKKVKKPACPICFEEMSGSTKIAQCNNGHLLCWSCKEKMKSNKCPSCRLPVDGRAFGMESYLRSLFGFD